MKKHLAGALAAGLLVLVGGGSSFPFVPPQQGMTPAQRTAYALACRRFSAALDARPNMRKQNWQCPELVQNPYRTP